MIEYTKRDIRTLSMLGQAGSVCFALSEMRKTDDSILAISADLKGTSGFSRFATSFPDSFINVGIAEQNMIGIACGMASCDYKVVASSFATFISLRAGEFARSGAAYMDFDVALLGVGSGFAMGQFGNTHYAMEDIALMKAIPGLKVISPSDGLEAAKAIEAVLRESGPAYLRITGNTNSPIVHGEDYAFTIGKAETLRSGTDTVLFTTGEVTYNALLAADLLSANGVDVAVIAFPTIKPFDVPTVLNVLNDYSIVFSIEEHSIIGGLGDSVASVCAEAGHGGKLVKIGIDDSFHAAGTREYLLKQCGLDADGIKHRVLKELHELT